MVAVDRIFVGIVSGSEGILLVTLLGPIDVETAVSVEPTSCFHF